MNEEELARNKQLTSYDAKDLNADPTLPYADSTFDFVFNVVSVDYLNKPLEVFKEMHRVLKVRMNWLDTDNNFKPGPTPVRSPLAPRPSCPKPSRAAWPL